MKKSSLLFFHVKIVKKTMINYLSENIAMIVGQQTEPTQIKIMIVCINCVQFVIIVQKLCDIYSCNNYTSTNGVYLNLILKEIKCTRYIYPLTFVLSSDCSLSNDSSTIITSESRSFSFRICTGLGLFFFRDNFKKPVTMKCFNKIFHAPHFNSNIFMCAVRAEMNAYDFSGQYEPFLCPF